MASLIASGKLTDFGTSVGPCKSCICQNAPRQAIPMATAGPHRTLELVDGAVPGLWFRLSPRGEKSWSLSARIGGIRRRVALGKNLWLADARRQAEHTRSAIAKGENPAEAQKAVLARRKDATRGMGTFGSVITAYYEQGPGESLRSGLAARALIERVFRDHLLRPALDVRTTELQLAIDAWCSKSSSRHCTAYFRPIARWACERGLMLKGEALEAPTLGKPNQRVLTRVELRKSCCQNWKHVGMELLLGSWCSQEPAARKFVLPLGAKLKTVLGQLHVRTGRTLDEMPAVRARTMFSPCHDKQSR
jgi:hypothetical protein